MWSCVCALTGASIYHSSVCVGQLSHTLSLYFSFILSEQLFFFSPTLFLCWKEVEHGENSKNILLVFKVSIGDPAIACVVL